MIAEHGEFGVDRAAVVRRKRNRHEAFPVGKGIAVTAGGELEELEIIAARQRRCMIRAASAGMKTPRRQAEAELSVGGLARVEIGHADHQMIDAFH